MYKVVKSKCLGSSSTPPTWSGRDRLHPSIYDYGDRIFHNTRQDMEITQGAEALGIIGQAFGETVG